MELSTELSTVFQTESSRKFFLKVIVHNAF
jgi:hypothetical protein